MSDAGGRLIKAATEALNSFHACNCIGPQRGEPLCPCQMRGIIQRDGRYIRPEQDLGPVVTSILDDEATS